jgi:hypothetical protein
MDRDMPIFGTVNRAEAAGEWAKMSDAAVHKLETWPENLQTRDPSGEYRLLYDAAEKGSWWVISAKTAEGKGVPTVSEWSLVAHCAIRSLPAVSLPDPGVLETACARYILIKDLAIKYSFEYSNLPRLAELDREVIDIVMSWRCNGRRGQS